VDSSKNATKGNISIDARSAKIYFNIDGARSGNLIFDGQFSKVFK